MLRELIGVITSLALMASIGCSQAEHRKTVQRGIAREPEFEPPKTPVTISAARPINLVAHEEAVPDAPGVSEVSDSTGLLDIGRRLSLSDLKELASQSNPTLAQAAAGVEAERGAMRQAGLYPNPQLGYINNSASPSSVQQSNGAFISQEFVTADKLNLARIWEGHEVNRVAWEAEAQRVRVLNDLTIRYYEVLGAQEAAAVAENLEKLAQDGLVTANSLVKNDQGSKNDILQAEIQLETMRMSKQDASFRQQAAWQQLANMIGDPQLPISLVEGTLDGDVPDLRFEETWQELTANSPQLAASQANLDHARAELNLARAQVVPNVTIQTVLQRDNATQSSQASTLLSLPVPVFNRNQGNIQRAQADICAAEAEISRTRLVLRDLLADSFKRYQTSRLQALGYRDKILPNAEKSMELASIGYKSGDRGFLELLTARQTYFQAKLASIEALTELRKVIVEIEGLQLTGGLNPAAIGTAIQSQPGGGAQRQRALLNQVQEGASRQLLPAAQLGR